MLLLFAPAPAPAGNGNGNGNGGGGGSGDGDGGDCDSSVSAAACVEPPGFFGSVAGCVACPAGAGAAARTTTCTAASASWSSRTSSTVGAGGDDISGDADGDPLGGLCAGVAFFAAGGDCGIGVAIPTERRCVACAYLAGRAYPVPTKPCMSGAHEAGL